jgi:hypothetical protein
MSRTGHIISHCDIAVAVSEHAGQRQETANAWNNRRKDRSEIRRRVIRRHVGQSSVGTSGDKGRQLLAPVKLDLRPEELAISTQLQFAAVLYPDG